MKQTWTTVRVFISSTFRDMGAERDHLVKMVFPELRERMARRGLHLVDVDLRWGITEAEAERGKALEICLDEIERCRPFFVGLLGERYGPALASLPEEALLSHPWLSRYAGHSITALEIVQGVLRDPEHARRSFFYFRDPRILAHIPEAELPDYAAESAEAAQKLERLKGEIRRSGRPVMEGYPCVWDDGGRRITGLERLGQRVLDDLWAAICAELPEAAPETDPVSLERAMHEAFAEERGRLHVGRAEQALRLADALQRPDARPVVITGESGCGKSAFLAHWSRQYAQTHPDHRVLAHFVGASPASTHHTRLQRAVCEEVKREFDLPDEMPPDDRRLPETMAALLRGARAQGAPVVLVVDALDQLLPQEGAHRLSWLLGHVPEGVRLVVSTLEGECLAALRERGAEEIPLPPLSPGEQRDLVRAVLGEWRRKLDGRQAAALLAHPGVGNPLYLRVALEELRLFGSFERLTERIEALAPDTTGLFDQVLARLERDHGQALVVEALSLLGSARFGLSEAELLALLRRGGEEQLPRALWARLERGLGAYLVKHGGLIGFFHRQLAEAVARRYLSLGTRHARLARYFAAAPMDRRLDEYAYQLQRAEAWPELAAALADPDLFRYAWDRERKYEWMGYWRALEERADPGARYRAALESQEKETGETGDVACLWAGAGWLLLEMGHFAPATHFLGRALGIRERLLPPDHPDTVKALKDLADCHLRQGHHAEALALAQRAVAIRERSLGPDHPEAAEDLFQLARVYFYMGNRDYALRLFRRVIAVREASCPAPDELSIVARGYLAVDLYDHDKVAEAAGLMESLAAYYERFEPDTPGLMNCLDSLGAIYSSQGRFGLAQSVLDRSLALRERVLGPAHPDVARSLFNLAAHYEAMLRFGRAWPLYRRALRVTRATLGADHGFARKCRARMLRLLVYRFGPACLLVSFAAANALERNPIPAAALSVLSLRELLPRPFRPSLIAGLALCAAGLLVLAGWGVGGGAPLGALELIAGVCALVMVPGRTSEAAGKATP